jgi:hypothetical protein
MDCVWVEEARYLGEYRIWLRFNDGTSGEADLRGLIFASHAAEPLREPANFAAFHLDSWPTLAWDCGFDVAPESLHRRVSGG